MKKRLARILIAALAFVPILGAKALSEAGDMNGCEAISAGDAAIALRAVYGLIKLDNADSITADVTGNMAVSGEDVTAILMKCTGKLASFQEIILPSESLLGEKHIDAFSFGKRLVNDETYRTDRVSVTLTKQETENAVCCVADIYLHNIESFQTAFSGGEYLKSGSLDGTEKIAGKNKAILAINGDFYSQRSRGPMVRNGVWYRESVDTKTDACVLYRDGTLVTFPAGEYDKEKINGLGAPWQAWAYGPQLLDEGGAVPKYYSKFTSLYRRTMRTAIGYFEPGHYCFVSVEGRANTNSQGMTIPELSEFMSGLGCVSAYNLAGGETSTMVFSDRIVNTLRGETRPISDIIMIQNPETGEDA